MRKVKHLLQSATCTVCHQVVHFSLRLNLTCPRPGHSGLRDMGRGRLHSHES
jgi:hypothetical protein